ncbi:hypothetical protein BFP77_14075 [Maribacter sp. 4U21]|uniref:PorP/SprF family type IX secretion system membrane protein n=1 Tax=Maribacter sp. 4U21 TaxID=1889779 RepID=UPI000C1451C5|nr:type IX secretion system membrane protein PorP/SprF [Maribacter sp. 4U21]PIB26903.1 hypothetical protein BFP77_14075 [Maribacter sp. 4U21]
MKFFKYLLSALVLSFSSKGFAQQESQYSQYMLNPLLFNPAYAGSREIISISALHRAQWLGIDGAPSTQNLSIHAPVWRRVGLGMFIYNDGIGNGTVQMTGFKAVFSYTLPLDKSMNTKLAFGLDVGGSLNQIDFSKLKVSGSENSTTDSRFMPNFGVGIFLRNPYYYVGFSHPNILENNIINDNNRDIEYKRVRTWLGTAGIVLQPFLDWKFKPATLVKITKGAPVQVDISFSTLFIEKIEMGISYRLGSATSALMGYHFSQRLYGGLAYDRELTDLGGQTFRGQSFEFLIRYEFEDRKCKCSPKPRFY